MSGYGSGAAPPGGNEVDSRTLEVLLQYRDQGVSRGFGDLSAQSEALSGSMEKSSAQMSAALDRQAQAWQKAAPPPSFTGAIKTVLASNDAMNASAMAFVKQSPRAAAEWQRQTTEVKSYVRAHLSASGALSAGIDGLNRSDKALRTFSNVQRTVNEMLGRTAALAQNARLGVLGYVDAFGRISSLPGDIMGLNTAIRGLGDGTVAVSQRTLALGDAAESLGRTTSSAAFGAAALGRGWAAAGGALGGAAGVVSKVAAKIAVPATVFTSVGKTIGEMSEAAQRGESVIPPFINGMIGLLKNLALAIAIAMGGWPLIIAAAVMALEGLYNVIMKVTSTYREFTKDLINYPLDRFLNPDKLMGDAGKGWSTLWDNTMGKMAGILRSLPGPMGDAQRSMDTMWSTTVGGAKKAVDGFNLVIGGLTALGFEMRSNESIANAYTSAVKQLGVNGDELLATINRESLGLISQAEAMEKVNTASALIGVKAISNVGNFSQVFTDMAKVSMAAARATGQDVEYMFSSIVTGIGRASPMILDNLGLAFRASEAYDGYAKTLGKAAKDLTVTEQKSALLTYVLSKGNEMVERYGISTGGVNTQIQRLGVVLKDTALQISLGFNPILKDFLAAIVGIVSGVKAIVPVFQGFFRVLQAIPEPIRNAVIAFGALNTISSVIASGPGSQLLSIFGLSGEQLGFMTKHAKWAAAGLMFLYTAYQKNYLGLKTMLEPLVRFPEMVKDAMDRVHELRDTQLDFHKLFPSQPMKIDMSGVLPDQSAMAAEGQIAAQGYWKGIQETLAGSKVGLDEIVKVGKKPSDVMFDYSQMTKVAKDEQEKLKVSVAGLRVELGKIGPAGRAAMGIDAKALAQLERLDFYLDATVAGSRSLGIELGDVRTRATSLAEAADRMGELLVGAIESARPHAYILTGAIAEIPEAIRKIVAGDTAGGFERLSDLLANARISVEGLMASFVDTAAGIAKIFGPDLGAAVDAGSNKVLDVLSRLPELVATNGIAIVQSIGDGIAKGAGYLQVAMQGIGQQIGTWLGEGLSKMNVGGATNSLMALFDAVVSNASKIYVALVGLWTEFYIQVGNIWAKVAPTIFASLASIFDKLATWLPTTLPKIWAQFWAGFTKMVDGFADFIIKRGGTAVVDGIVSEYGKGAIRLAGAAGNLWAGLALTVKRMGTVMMFYAQEWGPKLVAVFHEIKPVLVTVLGAVLGVAWTLLTESFALFMTAIGTMLADNAPELEGYMVESITNPERAAASAAQRVGEIIGSTVVSAIIGGIAKDSPGIAMVLDKVIGGLNMFAGEFYTPPSVDGLQGGMGTGGGSKVRLKTDLPFGLLPDPSHSLRPTFGPPSPGGATGGGGGGVEDLAARGKAIWDGIWHPAGSGGGAGGGMPDMGDEAGGDGKGGKAKKDPSDKSGGAEKDPLQEAMQAISSVSSAIQAGLAAMKAMWTDFLGEPPAEIMDQVFDALQHILDRALKLAGGAGLTALSAEGLQASLSVLSSAISSISAVVELSKTLMTMRPVDPARLEAAFTAAGDIGKWAFGLLDEMGLDGGGGGEMMTGLQDAVKSITLAGELAGVIQSWGAALVSIADATNAISRMRDDVDVAPVGPMVVQILKAAEMGVAEVSAFAGVNTIPMAVMQLKTVGESLGVWTSQLSAVIEIAASWDSLREPPANFLDGPKAWLMGVMSFAEEVTTSFTGKWGSNFMLRAEDAGIVGGMFEPWISAISGIIDAASAMGDVRSTVDLTPTRAWLVELAALAGDITGSLAGPKILRVTDDIKAVGDSLGPWPALLAGMGEVANAAYTVMAQMGTGVTLAGSGSMLKDLITFVTQSLPDWLSGLGNKPGLAMADMKALGESLAPYVSILQGLGDIAVASETVAAIGGRGVSANWSYLREILVGLGSVAAELVGGSLAHYGNEKVAIESWGNAKALGETLQAWTGLYAGLGELVEASRSVAKYGGVAQRAIETGMDLVEYLAIAAFARFGKALGRVGTTEGLAVSSAVASTLAVWRDLFTGMDEFTISLGRAQHGTTGFAGKQAITALVDLLDYMSVALWHTFQNALRGPEPGQAQETSSKLATNMATWLGTLMGAVDFSRKLREIKPVSKTDLAGAASLLGAVRHIAGDMASWLGDDPLPGATLDVQSQQAGALGAMVDTLSQVASLGRQLAEMVIPSGSEISSVVEIARTLWKSLTPLGDYITDLVDWELEIKPRLEMFASAFGDIMGVFGSVLSTDTSRFITPRVNEIEGVKAGVKLIWETFKDLLSWMPSLDRGPADAEDTAKQWGAWSTSVGSILSVVSSMSGIFIDRSDVGAITPNTVRVIRDNLELVFGLFEGVAQSWVAQQRVPEISSAGIGQWAQSAQALLGAAGTALSLGQALSGEDIPKLDWSGSGGRPAILDRLGKIVRVVFEIFGELSTEFEAAFNGSAGGDPNRARDMAGRMLEYLDAYSGSLGGMVGATSSLVQLLTTLTDQGHKVLGVSSTAKGVISQSIRDVVGIFKDLGAEFHIENIANRGDLAHVAEFAGQVNEILAPIKTAVDTILSLNDFIWEIFTPQEGEAPARPGSPWRYGSKAPHAVTDAGQKVYRRFIEVARSDIARVVDFIKAFWQELDTLRADLRREWESLPENGNADWNKYLAEFGSWTEKAGGAVEMVKNVSDAIESLMANPLTVLTYNMSMGGRNRNTPIMSQSGLTNIRGRATQVAQQAALLKESVKTMIRTLVGALKEAFDDPAISEGMPSVEKVARLNDLGLAVSMLTNALETIRSSFPERDELQGTADDIFMNQIRTFVDGFNLLQGVTIPGWMTNETIGAGLLSSLVNALGAIQDFSLPNAFVQLVEMLERMGDALGRIGGLGGAVAMLPIGGGGNTRPVQPGPSPDVNVDVSVASPQMAATLVLPNGALPMLADLIWMRTPPLSSSSTTYV